MKVIQDNLYDYPRYYDLVYGSDWKAEVDFLDACFAKHTSLDVSDVFEPACGTGRLLFRLAKAGYQVSGLDLNERAVEFCNQRLQRHGFAPTAIVGDMSDFRLPAKVDAAFNTINSFRHLTSERQARDHLRCVAGQLRKQGLYVLGLHLTPTAGTPMEEECWSARRGHLCVNTRLRTIDRDLKRREERFSMTYDVHTPTDSFRLADEIVFRTYTAPQFTALLNGVAELELVETYDFAYEIDGPITIESETEDVVFILCKC